MNNSLIIYYTSGVRLQVVVTTGLWEETHESHNVKVKEEPRAQKKVFNYCKVRKYITLIASIVVILDKFSM